MPSTDSPSSPKLSLAMIVKNRTDHLQRCLDSIAPYVDEIVIAWNGTNPATKKILESFNCKIIPYKWKNDFADARNASFANTSNELVLWLDDDDYVINAANIHKWLLHFNDPRVGSLWVPWDYDRDTNGNCTMMLYRERITRKSYWKWEGRLHETQIPTRACSHVHFKIDDPDAFMIKHDPGPEESHQSALRNLRVSEEAYKEEKESGTVDPRTILNYGKSLHATGRLKEAIEVLTFFNTQTRCDEDRFDSFRIMAQIYRSMKLFDQSINYEMMAMKIRPHRPEPYFGLAESNFCLERWEQVIWYAKIGFSCPQRPDNELLAYDPLAVEARPLLFLHMAFLQTGKFNEALITAKSALGYYPNNQFLKDSCKAYEELISKQSLEKSWLDIYEYLSANGESHKLEHLSRCVPNFVSDHPHAVRLINRFKEGSTGSNKLIIYCGSTYELWDPSCVDNGIGGSEEAVIYLAPLLAKLGWDVEVYNNTLQEGNYSGVTWKPFWTYDQSQPCSVFIAWRNSEYVELAHPSAYKVIWLHDKQKPEQWSQAQIDLADKILFLSNYHRLDMPELPDSKIHISSNGIIPGQFISITGRDPQRCVYASSPDRGLAVLLDAWPEIRKQVQNAELDVYYGFTKAYDDLHCNNTAMLAFKEKILQKVQQPGITYHGMVSHKDLARAFARSGLWLYPTGFPEISCITAMKAQAAGAIPICSDFAALQETVQYGVKIPGDMYTDEKKDEFVRTVVKFLLNEKEQTKLRKPMMKWAKAKFDWKTVAEDWDKLFKAGTQQSKPLIAEEVVA